MIVTFTYEAEDSQHLELWDRAKCHRFIHKQWFNTKPVNIHVITHARASALIWTAIVRFKSLSSMRISARVAVHWDWLRNARFEENLLQLVRGTLTMWRFHYAHLASQRGSSRVFTWYRFSQLRNYGFLSSSSSATLRDDRTICKIWNQKASAKERVFLQQSTEESNCYSWKDSHDGWSSLACVPISLLIFCIYYRLSKWTVQKRNKIEINSHTR